MADIEIDVRAVGLEHLRKDRAADDIAREQVRPLRW